MRLLRLIFAFTFLLIIIEKGFGQDFPTEYHFSEDITRLLVKDFIKKGLIDKEEEVIAVSQTDYADLNRFGHLYKETFTILTKDKILEFDQFGERVRKTEVLLNDILNVELSNDSSSIKTMDFDSIRRNDKFNEEHLEMQYAFFRNIMEDKEKGLIFYKALEKEWRASNSYEKNRNVYYRFFDANGEYIPRQSEILRSEKLKGLTNLLDSLSVVYTRGLGSINVFYTECFIQLDYDVNKEKYLVNKVYLEYDKNKEADTSDIIMNYEILVKDTHLLPFDSRGITFLKSEDYILEEKNGLIEYLE